jgi:hypothetical protein
MKGTRYMMPCSEIDQLVHVLSCRMNIGLRERSLLREECGMKTLLA